jgi:hypothetical protein
MKTAIDMIEGLRYKLWMTGIPLYGPTSVFCYNESVVKNSTAPESTLKKRHSQCFCLPQESQGGAVRPLALPASPGGGDWRDDDS